MSAFEVLVPNDLPPDEYRRRVSMAAIHAKYGSVQAFAEAIGVCRQAVYLAIAGSVPGGRVAGALSAITGIPRTTLFPTQEKAA
jgi:hypothetical protein